MKTLLLTLALLAAAVTVQGQPAPILTHTNKVKLAGMTFNSLTQAVANIPGGGTWKGTIYIGPGTFYLDGLTLLLSPGVNFQGAGTNWTFILSTNTTGNPPIQPGDNSYFQDFTIWNTWVTNVTTVTATFGKTSDGESSTNVFLNRIVHRSDTDCIYTGNGLLADDGSVNHAQYWVVSNNTFISRFDGIYAQSLGSIGAQTIIDVYNSDFVSIGRCRAPELWNGRGEVSCIRVSGTNAIVRVKNSRISAQGATNQLSGCLVDGGRLTIDNCSFWIGTNGIKADPALKRFSVYATNAGECWFKNMSGIVTNRVTSAGTGRFYHFDNFDLRASADW
jgi:hypothetical protein